MVILSSQANDRQLNCLIRIFRLVSIGEVPLYRHTYNLLKVYKKLTKFNSDFGVLQNYQAHLKLPRSSKLTTISKYTPVLDGILMPLFST